MAETDPTPSKTEPSKSAPTEWLSILDDIHPRWRDHLKSSKAAKDALKAFLYDLYDLETNAARHKLDASGKEIPDTNRYMDPRFLADRLLLVPDPDGDDEYLIVDYGDAYLDFYYPDGRWKFYVPRRKVARWERLYFPTLVAPLPAASKEPTSTPAPSEELSNKPRQKPGPKPDPKWGEVEAKCYDLMDHHGDFDASDPDWDRQARLEEALKQFCLDEWQHALGDSTLREKLPDWLLAWRKRKTGEA